MNGIFFTISLSGSSLLVYTKATYIYNTYIYIHNQAALLKVFIRSKCILVKPM